MEEYVYTGICKLVEWYCLGIHGEAEEVVEDGVWSAAVVETYCAPPVEDSSSGGRCWVCLMFQIIVLKAYYR